MPFDQGDCQKWWMQVVCDGNNNVNEGKVLSELHKKHPECSKFVTSFTKCEVLEKKYNAKSGGRRRGSRKSRKGRKGRKGTRRH